MTSILELNQLAKQSVCQIYLYSEVIDEPVENEYIPLSVHSTAGFTLFNDFELATIPAILYYGLKNTSDATVLGVHYIDKYTYIPDSTKCNELLQACRAQTNTVYQQIQLNNERIQVLQEQESRLQESMQRDMERQVQKEEFSTWFDDRKNLRLNYKEVKGGNIKLKFRVFNGSTYEQDFLETHTIKDLYSFINHFDIFKEDEMTNEDKDYFYKTHKDHGHGFVISSMFPKNELMEMNQTLGGSGVQGMLIVEEV